jgi:hypothetical protein
MRPHPSLKIVVIALGLSSGAIAASTSIASGGGGTSYVAGGSAHDVPAGGGAHNGVTVGHAAVGGGFSNSGRFGSANLGRGSFSQAIGNHVADHAIATKTALRTTSRAESDKAHPGVPEHYHHRRFLRDANPAQFNALFGACASLPFDRERSFVVAGPEYLLCGGALKGPTSPRTGRPAG